MFGQCYNNVITMLGQYWGNIMTKLGTLQNYQLCFAALFSVINWTLGIATGLLSKLASSTLFWLVSGRSSLSDLEI